MGDSKVGETVTSMSDLRTVCHCHADNFWPHYILVRGGSRYFHFKSIRGRVSEYATQFGAQADNSRWNDPALCAVYYEGLYDDIKDHLAPLDHPVDLHSLVCLAVKIDDHLEARQRKRDNRSPFASLHRWQPLHGSELPIAPYKNSMGSEELMQLGHTRLTPEEYQQQITERRCICYGQRWPYLAVWPLKHKAHQ